MRITANHQVHYPPTLDATRSERHPLVIVRFSKNRSPHLSIPCLPFVHPFHPRSFILIGAFGVRLIISHSPPLSPSFVQKTLYFTINLHICTIKSASFSLSFRSDILLALIQETAETYRFNPQSHAVLIPTSFFSLLHSPLLIA